MGWSFNTLKSGKFLRYWKPNWYSWQLGNLTRLHPTESFSPVGGLLLSTGSCLQNTWRDIKDTCVPSQNRPRGKNFPSVSSGQVFQRLLVFLWQWNSWEKIENSNFWAKVLLEILIDVWESLWIHEGHGGFEQKREMINNATKFIFQIFLRLYQTEIRTSSGYLNVFLN